MMQGNLLTLEEGCNKYLDNCRARNLREGTINHYRQSYTQFYKYFDRDMLVSDITQNSICQYFFDFQKQIIPLLLRKRGIVDKNSILFEDYGRAILYTEINTIKVGLLLSVYVKSVYNYIFVRSVCIKRNDADHRLLLDVAIQIYVDILIEDIAYETNLITSRSNDLIACFLTDREIAVNYRNNIRECSFYSRLVFLIRGLLEHGTHTIVLYFYVYILKRYIVDKAIASVLYIDRNVTASDKIASLKADILVFGRVALNTYFTIHSPAAPHYAIFNVDVFNGVRISI